MSVTVLLILAIRQVESIFQQNVTRYLIKTHISPKELPMWKWFSINFIKTLRLPQILSLMAIASFTLFTFPLGIWLQSFRAGTFLPLGYLFGAVVSLFAIPLSLWSLHKTVGEITFNHQTIVGLVIVELATLILVVGWWLIYVGNQ